MFNHTKDAVFLLTKIYLINPVILLFYPRPFYFIYKKKNACSDLLMASHPLEVQDLQLENSDLEQCCSECDDALGTYIGFCGLAATCRETKLQQKAAMGKIKALWRPSGQLSAPGQCRFIRAISVHVMGTLPHPCSYVSLYL